MQRNRGPQHLVAMGQRLRLRLTVSQELEIAETVNAIESVHSVPTFMPVILVRTVPFLRSDGAYYSYDSGEPAEIALRIDAPYPGFTMVHEIAHFIDHCGLAGALPSRVTARPGQWRALTAEIREALERWLDVVTRSEAYESLVALRDDPIVFDLERNQIDMRRFVDLDYLLLPSELWARSYSQYIVRKSGSQRLCNQLDELIRIQEHSHVSITRQWTDPDFAGIMEALDQLLGALRWLR